MRAGLAARQIIHLPRQKSADRAVARAADYAAARALLTAAAGVLDALLILLFTFGGGIAWLDHQWDGRPLAGAAMVGAMVAAFAMVRGGVRLYQSLVLDVRFGLARRAAGHVLASTLPGGIARIGVAAAGGESLAWLIGTGWTDWWIGAALLWGLFALWLEIAPPFRLSWLRSALRPLPEGALRQRLRTLLDRCGLRNAELRVRDSARYSRRANARVAGAWGRPRIELSDTLIALLGPQELEAVLAHEAGHWRNAHAAKDVAGRALAGACGIASLAAAMRAPEIGASLGLGSATPAGWAAAAAALLPLAGFFLTPLQAFLRRRFEYEADEFAARQTARQPFIDALRKLQAVNATVCSSDRLYAGFYATHPDPAARIRRLS